MTEQHNVPQTPRRDAALAGALLDAMSDGYAYTEAGVLRDVNDALCRLVGYRRDELVGLAPPYPFWPPESAADAAAARDRVLDDEGGDAEVVLTRSSGERFDAALSARPVRDEHGAIRGYVTTVRDVSRQRRSERELARLAHRDPLTDLLNHRSLHLRLDEEVRRAHRHGTPLSVAVLDLDHFKAINDRLGHLTGDHVLRTFADRLQVSVRGEEAVGRVGGEEFAWILVGDEAAAAAAAERVRVLMAAAPFGDVGTVTVSIGVAELRDGEDATELYSRADSALYAAKASGRDRVIAASDSVATAVVE